VNTGNSVFASSCPARPASRLDRHCPPKIRSWDFSVIYTIEVCRDGGLPCTGAVIPRYAQVFPNRNKSLHLSSHISCMQAFFLEEFCIVLLPAHPGAPSRGVLIGGAGAAPADGLASHLREPRGCCPALQRGPAIGGSSPPDECRRKPAGSGGRKVGPGGGWSSPGGQNRRGGAPRGERVDRKTRAAPRKRGIVDAPVGAPLPRAFFGGRLPRAPWGYQDRRTRRLTKTRADDAWLFDIVSAQFHLILRSGEAASRRMGHGLYGSRRIAARCSSP
jgi:hypothetical protein